jgi:hypothetical protein
VFVLSIATVARAQPIAIKDHPQKTVYNSAAEWLTVSGQCHGPWQLAPPSIITDPESFDPLRAGTGHVHLEPTLPYLGVITGPFAFEFWVRLFMDDAQVVGVWGPQVRNIVWDDTGSDQLPVMTEVASEHLKVWHAHAVFDPFIVVNGDGGGPVTPHGYFGVNLFARTVFATADGHNKQVDNQTSVPVYMLLDPNAPEAPITHYSKIIASRCTFRNDADAAGRGAWGVVAEEIREIVPIAPISTPWTLQATREFGGVLGYTYASQGALTAPSHQQMRIDPDLHAGNVGTLIDDQVVGNGGRLRERGDQSDRVGDRRTQSDGPVEHADHRGRYGCI